MSASVWFMFEPLLAQSYSPFIDTESLKGVTKRQHVFRPEGFRHER